jgi:amino acid transporter
MAWSAYAVEAAASFIPEFRDTVSDTRKALRISALVLLLVFTLTPLGLAGLLGEQVLADKPYGFLQVAADVLLGGGATLITLVLIAGILVLSVMGTADAGRALYQSSLDGLTVRQFGTLNRAGVPARAVTVQLLINVLLVLFVGNPLAVIVAGNVGYVLAHLLAVAGYVVLRWDRPDAPRPIRLARSWIGIAVALALFDALILIVGMTSAAITGYGGLKEVLIAVAVLAISQALYWQRRLQDRGAAVAGPLHKAP